MIQPEDEPIGFDIPIQENYPSFVDRYFTPRYVLDVHAKGDDMCVLFHSNRVSLVTLAPSHPVLTKGLKVVKVDFEASESEEFTSHKKRKRRNENTNRLDNKVSGKRKRGAQILAKMSLVCNVELEDGSVYPIRSGVPGLLIEVNENLIENPNLLIEKPNAEGYIALLLHKKPDYDKLLERMMTQEQYEKAKEGGDPQEISQEPLENKQETSDIEAAQASTQDPVKSEQNGNHAAAEVKVEVVDVKTEAAAEAKTEMADVKMEVQESEQ